MNSHRYKLIVAYDGTRFGGWQVQPNACSIQEQLQTALSLVTQEAVQLYGSGRTDAGVHALGQVAHCTVSRVLNAPKVLASLGRLLPPEIRALSIEEVPLSFHARYSARAKTYHYRLHLDPVPCPWTRAYTYHVPHRVDLAQLRRAGAHFVGTHNFLSFAHEAHRGSAAKDAVRTILRLDVLEEDGGARIECEGTGFLYKMVRNIVGTLLGVCAGKFSEEEIPLLLAACDRRRAGQTAPAQGLYLAHVTY